MINSYRYAGVSYLLDDYPATAAFTLRQLKETEVDVIRVRRSSDSAESDFNPTEINDGTLTTWTGANDGFVTDWYDQEGTNHAVQSTAGSQPLIVFSGTLATENGEAALDFTPSGAHKPPMLCGADNTFKTAWFVGSIKTYNAGNFVTGNQSVDVSGLFLGGTSGGFNGTGANDGTNLPSLSNEDTLTQHIDYWSMRSSKIYIDRDASGETDKGTFAASLANPEIGGRGAAGVYSKAYVQELVLYNSDESGNKSDIETNINNHYGAY